MTYAPKPPPTPQEADQDLTTGCPKIQEPTSVKLHLFFFFISNMHSTCSPFHPTHFSHPLDHVFAQHIQIDISAQYIPDFPDTLL